MRERLPLEIIPVSAEQSRTNEDNEDEYAASHAIDLDLNTWSHTAYGSSWLKVKLEKTFCILQVVSYNWSGNPYLTWTCSFTECSTCEGTYCSYYTLTVSSERTSSDGLPTVADCKYGDTVTIKGYNDDDAFSVFELAVIGKQGENI